MHTEPLYFIIKVIHLGSLIAWLGPTLGAWWMLRLANRQFGEPSMISQFLYVSFLHLLRVEHSAFVLLLISGAGMVWFSPVLPQPWLWFKLTLLLVVIIPLEIFDIWFSHYKLPRVFAVRHPSRPYSKQESALLHVYHQRFVPLALILLPPTILSIFWLAIYKPMW